MKIQSLYLKNFRRFEERTFEFPTLFTVLIGGNASGKTSILDALAFSAGCWLRGLDPEYQSPQSRSPRSIYPDDVRLVPGIGTEKLEQLPVMVITEGIVNGQTANMKWGGELSRLDRKKNRTDLTASKNLIALSKKIQSQVRMGEKGEYMTLPLLGYHGTGRLWAEHREKIEYKKQGSRFEGYLDCLSAKSSGKLFKSWFKTLDDRIKKFNDPIDKLQVAVFKKTIRQVVPEWSDIEFDYADDDLTGFFDDTEGKRIYLPFRMLSDGYKNFIGMVADIAFRCVKLNPHLGEEAVKQTPGVVLIDELDLHLHPIWQQKVVSDLKETFPKIQFIATTHSPIVVQSLKSEEIINLDPLQLAGEPQNRSLEESALFMGVPTAMSTAFEEKKAFAEKYLGTVYQNGLTPEMEEALNHDLEEFSDDPAFVAKLKIEKLFKTGKA